MVGVGTTAVLVMVSLGAGREYRAIIAHAPGAAAAEGRQFPPPVATGEGEGGVGAGYSGKLLLPGGTCQRSGAAGCSAAAQASSTFRSA